MADNEKKVAEILGVEVSVLHEKGARLDRKLTEAANKKYLKN